MTTSAGPGAWPGTRQGGQPGRAPGPRGPAPAGSRPLAVTGAMAAAAVTATGLVVLTPLVVAGWIAAPHAGIGLPGVLRTATGLWLAAHHVGFTLHGTGQIGMLPLGLVLLPGALLWRAGRWVVRAGGVQRLPDVGYAALALAIPYAALSGALALAGRSSLASPSLPQAVAASFLLALCAGGLGGARALAPWRQLARLLPPRTRSLVLGAAGSLAVLGAAGALLAGGSLAAHLGEFRLLNGSLQAGAVGSVLLFLVELAYLPNAVGWAVCFMLGPGFAVGAGTVVAPTGVSLGPLPAFPLLAALPTGAHASVPGWAVAALLCVPYLAGAFGGLLLAWSGPATALEVAPLWGFACGAGTGAVTGILAAFSGGPLGAGRLAAVGPSGWQAGLIATLEVGVAAGVAAGAGNWLGLRRAAARVTPLVPAGLAPAGLAPAGLAPAGLATAGPAEAQPAADVPGGDPGADGHQIYLDPWAGEEDAVGEAAGEPPPVGPSSLP